MCLRDGTNGGEREGGVVVLIPKNRAARTARTFLHLAAMSVAIQLSV